MVAVDAPDDNTGHAVDDIDSAWGRGRCQLETLLHHK